MEQLKKFLGTNLAFFIILTAVVFIIYGKTINYEFTNYDDNSLITRNISFISNPNNIPELFKTSCFYNKNYVYYRPLLSLSFALESMIEGNNTKIYHFSNIILFILSIFLIYIFLKYLGTNGIILKLLCLLLAVHPIFSSSVAWIPARNDTILLIFISLSFINLISFLNYGRTTRFLLFILFFSAAIFTKESALGLIPLYLFFILIFNFKLSSKQIISIVSSVLFIIGYYFYLRTISVSGTGIISHEWHTYLFQTFIGIPLYISKFLIPDYMPVMLYHIKFTVYIITVNILFLMFIAVAMYKKLVSNKTVIFGIVWFILWIVPTFLMKEYILLFHRFLIPSVGIVFILSEIINNLIIKYILTKKYILIFFAVLFCFYSFASYMQSEKYKNAPVFWAYAYSDAPDYHVACNGLGQRFMEIKNYEKALELLSMAENYSPNRYLLDIAAVFLYQQKFDEAEKLLLKSIELRPLTSDLAYGNLAKLYAYKKDFKKAMEYANKTYELNKYDIELTKLLITIYTMNSEFNKALDMCFSLLKYDKKNAQYYYKIGELYELMKDYKNALKYIEEGLKLSPENVQLIEKSKFLKNKNNENI